MSLKLSTYRFKAPRSAGEGLRIGVVRFPPRGVKKKDYPRLDYFDIWFPLLAPGKILVSEYKERLEAGGGGGGSAVKWFRAKYIKELNATAEKRQAVVLLAEMARRTPVSIGCYCKEETECHRTALYGEIKKASEAL